MAVISIDIGGTKIASAAIIPAEPQPLLLNEYSIETQAWLGGVEVLHRLLQIVTEQYRYCERQSIPVEGIAVSSAGVIDSHRGVVLSATDLMPGWGGIEIASSLRSHWNIPVRVLGDVNAHGLGEALFGAGKGKQDLLIVGVGTGIGGALIRNGQVQIGSHCVAGHIGHVTHPLGKGWRCSCGSECGHIEPVASGSGLVNLYNALSQDRVNSGKEVSERAASGESIAIDVVSRSAAALGECVGGVVNLIDPDAVILSGSVTQAGEIWWESMREGFARSVLPILSKVPLVKGDLGNRAPLLGAYSFFNDTTQKEGN